ncbi:hypothetical protein [Rhodococcoides fascians]|uniref:hypothetical protein n=1 Tax=Rhodococcoides fascians TaxID=1828 RepID=UPI00050CC783|nr:hypothetical protein [Rhodococcus fascians]
MKMILRGEVYNYPPYAECDLDALIEWRMRALDQATNLAVEFCNALIWRLAGIPPLNLDFLQELPAAAGLSGAGSPGAGERCITTTPGTPNETRNR